MVICVDCILNLHSSASSLDDLLDLHSSAVSIDHLLDLQESAVGLCHLLDLHDSTTSLGHLLDLHESAANCDVCLRPITQLQQYVNNDNKSHTHFNCIQERYRRIYYNNLLKQQTRHSQIRMQNPLVQSSQNNFVHGHFPGMPHNPYGIIQAQQAQASQNRTIMPTNTQNARMSKNYTQNSLAQHQPTSTQFGHSRFGQNVIAENGRIIATNTQKAGSIQNSQLPQNGTKMATNTQEARSIQKSQSPQNGIIMAKNTGKIENNHIVDNSYVPVPILYDNTGKIENNHIVDNSYVPVIQYAVCPYRGTQELVCDI